MGNLNKGSTVRNTRGLPFNASCECTGRHEGSNLSLQTLFSYQSTPQSRTPPVGGPSWAYLPYLPLESEARERRNGTQAEQAFMHACVCSNHAISPRIIGQSSDLSLHTMFALLHCTFTITRDKQCACCIRSKQDLYFYTLFFEFILSFLDSFFFIAPTRKPGISTSIIHCVSRHFLIST